MNNLNSTDDIVECPLCMEPLEVDDLNFYPCTCGYQICRFCWHRIRTDENQLCPACRKEYPENPADFKPLSQEEMVAFKFQKRQRDQKRKQEITENRKHLANVRVVQKNLVFVVGLPPRLADAEILKKHEYFGKYGKIHKVVINPSTAYAGVQGPSASAYVTYVHNPDALRAIQSVNNIMIDGRLIKTSLGTTKYCSHFMKNQQCPKSDCMYLHELGDPEASFTKEEMHQGKHQDYEKRLHDVLIATSGSSTVAGGGLVTTTTSTGGGSSALITSSSSSKVLDSGKSSGGGLVTSNSSKAIAAQSHDARDIGTSHTNSSAVAVAAVNGQQTEAWPSLSVSPVNKKDSLTNNNVGKSKKERQKQEKAKAAEKNGKTKNKNQNNGNSNNHHSNHTLAKDGNETMASKLASLNTDSNSSGGSSSSIPTNITDKAQRNQETKERNSKQQSNNQSNNCQSQPQRKESDYNPAAATEPETLKKSGGGGGAAGGGGSSSNSHHQTKSSTEILSKSSQEATQTQRETARQSQANKETNLSNKTEENPQNQLYVSNSNISNSSISSSSSSSSSSTSSNSNHESNLANDTTTTNLTKLRNSPIPQDMQKLSSLEDTNTQIPTNPEKITNVSSSDSCPFTESIERTASLSDNFNGFKSKTPASVRDLLQQNSYNALNMDDNLDKSSMGGHHVKNGNELNVNSTTTTTTTEMPKLSLFDDNSFFSLNSAKIPTTQSLQQQQQQQQHHSANQLLNSSNKFLDDPLLTGRTIANLPDLINGIDGYQTNINCTNDWEDAFKSVILKTNKQMEEKLQQQQLQQHIHNHHQLKQQEDLRKLQELQKRNILLNSIRASQMQGGGGGPLGGGSTVEQLQRQSHFMPPLHNNPLLQSQLQANAENVLQNPNLSFETNMSKFFDFHKHQQQQKLQHYGGGPSGLGGGLVDNFHMMSLLENKPLNSQLLDHNSLINTHLQQQQQQQQQKQKLYQKMDPLMHHQQQLQQQQQHPQANQKHPVNVSSLHTPQNHLKNQYMQNSNADDDLGFDPFIETQKALAELIENEEEQMHHTQNTHSSPIAPPGKQPMNQPNQPPPPPPHQDAMLEYMQRLRMPPPGFNHLNSNLGGGYGGGAPMDPRLHTNQNSKILPFMNLPGNNQQHMPPQQHPLQMPNPNVWGTHMQQQQQQQQQQSMTGLRHDNLQTPQTMGNQKSGYSGSDWTAMDPAILSFRQFSFPQQQQQQQQQMPGGPPQQMPPLPQQQQQQQPPQDLFLQHLSQQSVGGGFGLGGGPQLNGPMTNAAAVAAGLLQSQAQQHHSSQTGHVNVDANVQGMLEFLKTQQYV